MIPDIEKIAVLVREVAEAEILSRFRRLEAGDVREKTGPRDLVTAADLAVEERLSGALAALLPGSLVVGEEAAAADPGILGRLETEKTVWLIDPLDGTLNFTEGKEEFTVIVALVQDGEAIAGWIHHPLSGETVTASRGDGAWMNGQRLRVAAADAVERMTGALYVGPSRAPELFERLQGLRGRLGPRSMLRCAGAEHMALARGTVHYAVFTRLLPWDHAAGCLIHGEAGGHHAHFDGQAYMPAITKGPFLLAPDEPTWAALHDLFAGSRAVPN